MKTFKTGLTIKYLFLFGLALMPLLMKGQIIMPQAMKPGGTFGLVDVNELKGGLMMVDNLADRDQIFMNRTKRGMMVVVLDADAVQAGDQTKTFMFTPSEDPSDYNDGGKIWNTYDEYSVHTIAQFVGKYGLNPWIEVSLGFKDPNGPGIDTIFISTSFIDTIFSNTGDTLFLMDKVKTDSLYADYLNLSGIQILGISTDETFANASNDSIVTQLAIKNYIQSELSDLTSNANITNLTVDTLTADTAFISVGKVDTLSTSQLIINNDTIQGISDDTGLGGAASSNDSLSTQLAVKTYVDDRFTDFGENANITNLSVDTLTVDTAFISRLLNNVIVSDSINVDTLIAVYTTMDTASINKVAVNYFTLNGFWVASISNDTSFASADSTALITEFAVQNRIDSIITYVNNEFSSLSQNSIENPLNSSTRIVVNENDSLVFTVNGDTAMVIRPDGSVVADTLMVNQLALSGDTIKGISTDIALGGVDASNDTISTQLAVKTYVDTEIAKLSGATTTDTLRANVAYIGQAYLDTIVADTAFISQLAADSIVVDVLKPDSIIMDGDTLVAVAASGDVVPDTALDKTLVTAGYVKNTASAFPEGLNPVTRTGWSGVSGQDLDADNVVDFLKRVFFPVPEPMIASVGVGSFSTETLVNVAEPNGNLIENVATRTIPYATWKNGFTLDIAYNVINRSAEDPQITTTDIESIAIQQGSYTPAPILVGNSSTPVSGTFASVTDSDLNPAPNVTSTNDYLFTTIVTDAYPNVNTLNWNLRLSAALRATVPTLTVNPTVVEDNGGSAPYDIQFTWSFNPRDEAVSDVTINGVSTGLTASGNITSNSGALSALQMNTSTHPTSRTYTLLVDGDLYTDRTQNASVSVCDRAFRGVITIPQSNTIDAGTFVINTTSLPLSTLCENWVRTNTFFDFSTPGGQDYYVCFAVPKSLFTGPPTIVVDTPLGPQDESGTVVKEIMYTFGSKTVPYYVVYSTTSYNAVGVVKARLRQ